MADEMMRISGRGADGKAKAIKTDNNGSLSTHGRISSEAILQNNSGVVGTGLGLDVEGYSSVIFEVIPSIDFDGEIHFVGKSKNSLGGTISLPNVLKESPSMFLVDGSISTSTLADVSGAYSVNIAGMKTVSARIRNITSGTVTIKAIAYSMPNLLIQNLLLTNNLQEIINELTKPTKPRLKELGRVVIEVEPSVDGEGAWVISDVNLEDYPINFCAVRADSSHSFRLAFYYKAKNIASILPEKTVIDGTFIRANSEWIEAQTNLMDVVIENKDNIAHTYSVVLYGVG